MIIVIKIFWNANLQKKSEFRLPQSNRYNKHKL